MNLIFDIGVTNLSSIYPLCDHLCVSNIADCNITAYFNPFSLLEMDILDACNPISVASIVLQGALLLGALLTPEWPL